MSSFEIRRHIETGRLGELFDARSDSGEHVAAKVIAKPLADDQRFWDDVVAAAGRTLPGTRGSIASYRGIGEIADGTRFVAREWIYGVPLSHLQIRSFRVAHAIAIALGIADALANLHAEEDLLVHGGISPWNVFIEWNGRVRVSDFGLGAVRLPAGASPNASRHLAFQAPEVRRGEAATQASDVWAAAAVLLHLHTGAAPVAGRDVEPKMDQLADRAVFEKSLVPMLSDDPRMRPNATRLVELFEWEREAVTTANEFDQLSSLVAGFMR